MNIINRRTVLTGMAVVSATVAPGLALADPGSTTAAEASHALAGASGPITVADFHRLSRELSEALERWSEHVGGEWEVHVQTQGRIWNEILDATRHRNMPSDEFARLILEHREAAEELDAACPGIDHVLQRERGKRVTKVAQRRFHRAGRNEGKALSALCSYRCFNDAERNMKARYLLEFHDGYRLEAENTEEILASMLSIRGRATA